MPLTASVSEGRGEGPEPTRVGVVVMLSLLVFQGLLRVAAVRNVSLVR
jgi:hypothetical protein